MKPASCKPVKARPHKPAKRSPAVIRAGVVYSWQEAQRRLDWKEHAARQARVKGLRLIVFGCKKYVLGDDILSFFKRLADSQTHSGSVSGEGE